MLMIQRIKMHLVKQESNPVVIKFVLALWKKSTLFCNLWQFSNLLKLYSLQRT